MGAGAGGLSLRGARLSPEERANSSKSRAIDRALSKDHTDDLNRFKILLLGTAESGKSTIFRQMRVLHLDGYAKEDALEYLSIIHSNCMEALTQLVEACSAFGILHDITVQEDVDRFEGFKKKLRDPEGLVIPVVIGRCMDRVWQSPSMQMCYETRRFRFALLDSAKYFMDNIVRLTEDNYVPTIQDIVHCRISTTGINEIAFNHKKMDFKMVDVGGQRSERRKWIHCFDNVDMILFIVSMSDYDQLDPEDHKYNRMKQSYEIFKTIVHCDLFRHASIVLFLNKYDVFVEKLKTSPLRRSFKSYDGDNSEESARDFIKKLFRRCITDRHKFFVFETTATDTGNIDLVFGSAVAHIVNENLRSAGLHE
ncbi:unnamed protein product [Caenorhabditis nigoni]|uniref:Uncharacterized protein n=1 Tax=Caenorhabditis nigoni TaxID=1611254 RepID=A0A2G5SZW3_9PELO|nr:hypothetical protein B9Z55_025640 [Caenorhabditis nigoni]